MIKLLQSFLLLTLISICLLFPAAVAFADDDSNEDAKELDISLSPKDKLFDINNMKPGDWAPRSITVTNPGSDDFTYHMELQNTGDKKLFSELMLEIKAGNQELYQGKLAAFESLSDRKLISGEKEELEITVRFPDHLGNDFQGLHAAFSLVFTAENKDSLSVQAITKATFDSNNDLTKAGFHLPGTSTNIFNLMLLGSVLITAGIVTMFWRRRKRISTDK